MNASRAPARVVALAIALAPVCTASGQTAPRRQLLAPIDAGEVALVAPLLDRGPVVLARVVGMGADSRATVFVRVHATMARVREVIVSPLDYPAFVTSVQRVELLSQHDRRAAYRFHASAVMFDVTADLTVHAVNSHRVDIDVPGSVLGAAGSRWELFADGTDTIAALTAWCDPAQASWMVRQLVGRSAWASSSASITAETVLALATARRAEMLAGSPLPRRPMTPRVHVETLAPPAPGPWMQLANGRQVVVSIALDAQGSLAEVTATGWSRATPDALATRFATVERYPTVWPWWTNATVHARDANTVDFDGAIGAPFVQSHGGWRVGRDGDTVACEGISGDFQGERRRWDTVAAPQGGTYVMNTSDVEVAHPTAVHRMVADRDPWIVTGMNAFWSVVTLRFGLAGM